MVRYYGVMAVAVAAVMAWGDISAQTPDCGALANTDAQIARRRMAIVAARQINTAQAEMWTKTRRYAPLAELTGVAVPDGFEAQVSTDGTTYTFSVKDMQDGCKAAVFADQIGLIYAATPIR
jgi:hypothetical protein